MDSKDKGLVDEVSRPRTYNMVSVQFNNPHKKRFPNLQPWGHWNGAIETTVYTDSLKGAFSKMDIMFPLAFSRDWKHYFVSVTPVKVLELEEVKGKPLL